MPETPEQKARHAIDARLTAAGWLVQERDALDLTAGRGIAVCEFPLKPGFGVADYLLYLDRKAIGAVEAKAGGTLTGVEPQSAKYGAGLPENLPAYHRPLPFLFEANGAVTQFTNALDPVPRSRQVFNFPRPETLSDWVVQPDQLRRRLRQLPELDESRLWDVQALPSAPLSKASQSLRQSILRHAFIGQLVPQDPRDEPASELLKRIAAERAARTRETAAAKRPANPASGLRTAKRGRRRKLPQPT